MSRYLSQLGIKGLWISKAIGWAGGSRNLSHWMAEVQWPGHQVLRSVQETVFTKSCGNVTHEKIHNPAYQCCFLCPCHVIAEVQPKLEYRPCCLWCRMLIRCNDGSDWIILACQLVDYCCLVTLSLSRDLKALSTSTQKFFCTNWFKVSKMSSSCIHCILFHGSRIQNMFTIKVSSA